VARANDRDQEREIETLTKRPPDREEMMADMASKEARSLATDSFA